ncbi:GntR family transcriptional regulator [Flavobacterium pallidum]|uniref:Transcriptional regulator n=1 Tax=Flavobacterium pallidum TaxID=2172098 RepID=A0A2S1SG50_9FLAO|nr:GntR family transcriptional regulator [Flavobacterium pallidum]AWI25341.1 transcriptional regulator [Flavobacterium pallidum]
MKIITIQSNLGIPKYRQIIGSIEKAIEESRLQRGVKLPSVNKISMEFSLSRDTVLLAYEELKKRGIVFAIPGKGYYVKSTEVAIEQKIFLLFDELNSFKEDLYNSFMANIGGNARVDIFFHHFNSNVFRKLIDDSNGNYTKYVIMPTNLPSAAEAIKTLPVDEVFILDQTNADLDSFPSVHQNFVKDIYDALLEGRSRLQAYDKMIMIFPGFREPMGMKEGFVKFCTHFNLDFEVIPEFDQRNITKGEVYIIPNDRDLVRVIEQSNSQELVLGTDFGIISYNETPLKKIVANGITTISTDFNAMGKIMAGMVIENSKKQIENQSALIMRNSL